MSSSQVRSHPLAGPGLLRRMNRALVLNHIRRKDITTSPDIIAELGISPATTMRVIEDLTAEGLVAHDGYDESSGGRPRARIRFDGAKQGIIGIEASQSGFRGAVTNLRGEILFEQSLVAGTTGPENVERLILLIERLMAKDRPGQLKIIGIGVGVPSIVRQPSGEVVLTLGLDWHDLPLQALLTEHFHLPVVVENDRNLAAMGEWGFGAARGAQSVVSLAIIPGAGAGIVVDGRLIRGRANASGEVSWFLDDPLLCGRTFRHLGDKDQLRFGGIAGSIADELAALAKRHSAGALTVADIESAGPEGRLSEVLELLDYTTVAVAALISILNPAVIVLTGGVARGGDLVLQVIEQRLAGNVFDLPRLEITTLGSLDIVLGAIHAVLETTILDSDR